MGDFRKLLVWQKAHAMSLDVDKAVSEIRGSQHGHLRNQLTRAAASVPANIVEGKAHTKDTEFARFLGYAVASSSEAEYHLIATRDKGLLSDEICRDLTEKVVEVRKMLYGLIDKLDTPDKKKRPPQSPEADS
jgi:four helix bundle protein